MSTLRVYKVGLTNGAVDPKLRVYKAGLTGPASTEPNLRVYKVGITGPLSTVPKLRVYKAGLTGPLGIRVLPLVNPGEIEPETLVSLTALLSDGNIADTYTWRRISGPAISFMGSTNTRSFYSPSLAVSGVPTASTVVVGVTATVGGVVSPEVTVSIDVRPQLRWMYQSGVWVGRRPALQYPF